MAFGTEQMDMNKQKLNKYGKIQLTGALFLNKRENIFNYFHRKIRSSK